ncbi:MAG TPA: nucleoside 2-deoxyribosyltransferase, partial [Rhizobiaceae bacterium]|nr:nucleoside 2-deoxyribosyltransferase [Rhizobiaceae bacterium]
DVPTVKELVDRIMAEADAIIANLTPWRGVSADAGTVYELGFMCALGKIVYAYTNVAASHFERVRAHYGEDGLADGPGMWRGPDGLRFEDFGMMDNLMLQGGVERRGGKVVIGNAAPDALYTDTTAFAKCLSLLARPDER